MKKSQGSCLYRLSCSEFKHTPSRVFSFFLNDPAPPEIYPFPLHAALPIGLPRGARVPRRQGAAMSTRLEALAGRLEAPLLVTNLVNVRYLTGFEASNAAIVVEPGGERSEEHTSELQSLAYLVCRLLLEKKK